MSNYISSHFENGENFKVNVSEEQNNIGNKYRVVNLGNNLSLFITPEQAEKLFDELDRKLHDKTWLQMEEIALGFEVDIEEMQSTIDFYREQADERRAN